VIRKWSLVSKKSMTGLRREVRVQGHVGVLKIIKDREQGDPGGGKEPIISRGDRGKGRISYHWRYDKRGEFCSLMIGFLCAYLTYGDQVR